MVCQGNICRSPMAQGLLAAALPDARVSSAGTGALIGNPAEEEAVQLMQTRGIDISAHRAVQITREMCLQADVVMVMEAVQRRYLQDLYPEACGRIFRLGEYTRRDVPDPYRKPATAFREALSVIDEAVAQWLLRLRKI